MLTTPQLEHPEKPAIQDRETLTAFVRNQVIRSLGRPAGLLSVQVRPLWGTRYRVNVFAGTDVASAKVTDSFFLVTDEHGNILESTPKITRRY